MTSRSGIQISITDAKHIAKGYIGKEYIKAVYCNPAYFIKYIMEMPDYMKPKLEWRLEKLEKLEKYQ